MADAKPVKRLRCAVYTRKSSDEGLEQSFNSLHAQREACEAYVLSQKHEGWSLLSNEYDDGGFSGGSMERPGLKQLMADVGSGLIDIIIVYKVDRLTRSLADFAKMVELFDKHGVSFVSVTQAFNTTNSMGRLTLNVLLSFAQFEREVTGERIRDKIAASKAKGMWMGGMCPLGYDPNGRSLKINDAEARHVRQIFSLYLKTQAVDEVVDRAWRGGIRSKVRTGKFAGGGKLGRGSIYRILANPIYVGEIAHGAKRHVGTHEAIVSRRTYDKAQAILGQNRRRRRNGGSATEPSLLAGLVHTGDGERLTSSHTSKGVRRYRYYVGEAKAGEQGALRIPAAALQRVVLDLLASQLGSSANLLMLLLPLNVDATEALACGTRLAKSLSQTEASEVRETLLSLVERIEVHSSCVKVRLKAEAVLGAGHQHEPLVIEIPATLGRRKQNLTFIVPGQAPRTTDQSLLAIIAQGRDWLEQLTSGSACSVTDLAGKEGVTPSYASRLIATAAMSPRMVEMILRGEQPERLTASTLLSLCPLPLSWAEQEQQLLAV